jgi:hypothetical protein
MVILPKNQLKILYAFFSIRAARLTHLILRAFITLLVFYKRYKYEAPNYEVSTILQLLLLSDGEKK